MIKRYIFGLILFGVSLAGAQTNQELTKEVKIVTAYRPVVSDAKRISELPEIIDTARFIPTFSYQVYTRPLVKEYAPSTIPAVSLVGEPLSLLYGSRLKIGGGNYSTLYGDYRYNNLRSKTYDVGVHLQHYSSNGKIKLENDDKERMLWSSQKANLFGKRYFDESELGGEILYRRQGIRYYGFPNVIDNAALPLALERDQELTGKQRYTELIVDLGYATRFTDENRMNYSAGVNLCHFADKFAVTHDILNVRGKMIKRHENSFRGVDGSIQVMTTKGLIYWDENEKLQNKRKSGFVEFKPYLLLQPLRWNIRLGLATYVAMGDDSDLKLYPDLNFEYQAVPHIITLFARLGGELEINDYRKIIGENPFVYSGLNVNNTDNQFSVTGGVKGNFSSEASFSLSADYSIRHNQYFYIKYDALSLPEMSALPAAIYSNKFGVVYDDVNLLTLSADIDLKLNDRLNIETQIKGFRYAMQEQEKAWHKPELVFNVDARYKYDQQWSFNSGVKVMGRSFTLRNGEVKTISGMFDLRLGVEYRIDRQFTAFARLNNVLADKYYIWDGYPMQLFNALAGVSYTF